MSNNSILNNAKYSDNTDEWYTTYEIIDEELSHYKKQFNGKVVLCNCDDPFESNFAYYFMRNFNILNLKKLICTSYGKSKINLINNNSSISHILESDNSEQGTVLIAKKLPGKKGEVVDDKTIISFLKRKGSIKRLEGSGDFRTEECIEYLKECDICCTNPPFSLFADLFSLLVKHKKKYLLIGNQNAITYKEVFPQIKKNKAWVGYRFGDMPFRVPQDTKPRKTRFWVDEDGQKWRSLGNAMWLTNLSISKKSISLDLKQRYSKASYPKYDNYNAIHVKRVVDIPEDYKGVMGVPITFLKYHNKKDFEIIGEANHGSDNEYDLFKPILNGKEVFKRILIKRKPRGNK